MAKDYAESFYNSTAWRKCRLGYMQSVNYVCEKCKGVGEICHHIEHITPKNIEDPKITLSWGNLQSLCIECHNKVHGNFETTAEGLVFNSEGHLTQS